MAKVRLDVLLIDMGLSSSREKAKSSIKEGFVYVNGKKADKAGLMVNDSDRIEVLGPEERYVSRGGYKLEKAVEVNNIDLTGKVCMDVGASTGGFTDCMLQRGACRVYAVDVGTAQLADKLKRDERVISMEQTNIRYLSADMLPEAMDFVSVDVSFISLTKVLLPIKSLVTASGCVCCLIKPQFEAGRDRIGKKGVVREPKTHVEVISDVIGYAFSIGYELVGLDYSPIRGPEGNIEYLMYLRNIGDRPAGGEIRIPDELIQRTVTEAHASL